MNKGRLRVLCLDIEGGYGGSSRSLYYLLKHIDPAMVQPEVWCKRDGPVVALYQRLGIPVSVESALPKVSSLPRFSVNIYQYSRYFIDFVRSAPVRSRLVTEINRRFDVVHFNHESLFLLACWLRSRVSAGFVMHNRTMLWDTHFARWQARKLVQCNDENIFITENERENINRLATWNGGSVVHNVVEPGAPDAVVRSGSGDPSMFTVVCLANYSWMRGVDRLIDIAAALPDDRRGAVRFVVCGHMALAGRLPGLLGEIAAHGGTLVDYAKARGVADLFEFPGHVSNPEQVLAAADLLIKPSREDNPWGRDILEAMASGVPVIACGTKETFVTSGESGLLYPHDDRFQPAVVARDIVALMGDAGRLSRMGEAARQKVGRLCNGSARASDLVAVWQRARNARIRSFGTA